MANQLIKKTHPFTKGIFPVYKDSGITAHQIKTWIRQTLQFECPQIQRGSLYIHSVPCFPELYQTGVLGIGFGFTATQLVKYRRNWMHDYLVTATLGKQTDDFYSDSPVIARHPHQHITEDTIRPVLEKFVGEIEQLYPPLLHSVRKIWERHERLKKKYHPKWGMNSAMIEDEQELSEFGEYLELNETEQTISGFEQKLRASTRLVQCHSIELLKKTDAQIQLRVRSNALLVCRQLVADIGKELDCWASIDALHLQAVGPLSADKALAKHELHLEQIIQSIEEHTQPCQQLLRQLKELYPPYPIRRI